MKPARGQAAVELALGMIVLVTILMFGIHFGEMGYLGAKVHEAAASAMWDSTAYSTHQVTQWYNSNAYAVPAGNGAAARYADFDGRTSHAGAAPKLAMTQAQAMTLNCVKAGAYALPAPSPFGEPGGISCSAQAQLGVINLGSNFLDGANGFFGEAQRTRSVYTVCSTGRLRVGGCGRIQMLLGDDGLHDGSEQGECTVQGGGGQVCGDNPHFYTAAKMVFDATMPFTGEPENWASGIIPNVPGNQLTGFYMSFRGDTSPHGPFNERLSNGDIWETNPHFVQLPTGQPYATSYNQRAGCAMGGYCYLGKFNCN